MGSKRTLLFCDWASEFVAPINKSAPQLPHLAGRLGVHFVLETQELDSSLAMTGRPPPPPPYPPPLPKACSTIREVDAVLFAIDLL